MAANLTTTWTPEMDAILKAYWRNNLPAEEIAALMGMTQAAVRGRAGRIGIKFTRPKFRAQRVANKSGEGHRPFTERCGEIMRAHGVKI